MIAFDRVSEAASIELKPFGIRVVEVSPGAVKTTFDEHFGQYKDKNKEYEQYDVFMDNIKGMVKSAISPQDVADCVVRVCKGEEKDFRVYPVEQNKSFHAIFAKDPTYSNYQNFAADLVTKKT
ncbi:Short-chain dehydrogenase/reductase SDR [Reticulomyxa filosa]|uniref:Short-chain dehydrogenase/reductase SDR n=1 Tax=Reticulomyxa filosa TaxID=46433 RepID=X6NFG9_RETFI|nr:Short-chain dehydrogenase/reductase SDR [Reticulomyxa filosa]|eukprot:ETO24087.1 Short-chain dehydrogenase/reductase SDR [Reticulomyxa filosa]